MARILNFAIMSNNNDMIEEISNIYQNKKPWLLILYDAFQL
jgi:hypothetical protein